MRCLVLAGGLGTRLEPVTRTVPKCLIPVAGRPFAHWQLEWLASEGVAEVVYSIGHLGDMVRAALGDGKAFGRGGALRRRGRRAPRARPGRCAWPWTKALLGDDFFVLYGDSWLSITWRRWRPPSGRRGCPPS